MGESLVIQRRGRTLELRLNRPGVRNALSRELIDELTSALRGADSDSEVGCVLLTGTPPAFCAGLDLREVEANLDDQKRHDCAALLGLLEIMDGLSKPVVGAVSGVAAAGGAALVCLCDVAVFGESAEIGYPGIRRGLIAPVVLPSLMRAVGERRARELLLTGNMWDAQRAASVGLAHEVVPDESVLERASEVAGALAGLSPGAVSEARQVLRRFRGSGAEVLTGELRGLAEQVWRAGGRPDEMPGSGGAEANPDM